MKTASLTPNREALISKQEILTAIDNAFRELESQKYALDQSAIVAITNVKGDIIYVNDQFCKISQYSREELLGQNHRIINSGHHPESFFTDLWKTIAKGKVWQNNIKNKAKGGSYYWVATTITPFLNEKGKPYMYVSIRFEITKQKQLEEELEQKLRERTRMLEHLSNQNKQLEDFCYIISHNMRAPLANLSLLGDMIEDTTSTNEKLDYVDKLKPIVTTLHETFEQLVESVQTRMDFSIKRNKLNLEKHLAKNLALLQADILASRADIQHDFSKAPDITYPEKYLDSIFLNLLSNAIKYSSPDRIPKIQFSSSIKGDSILLKVKDNGLGLDMERNGSKLFKLRKTFHSHPEAKGFGLFITKTQVEAMGGKIWAESKPDKGSTFIIEFKTEDLT